MSLGNNGDLYIDRGTGDYYAKVDGVWVFQGNITGPQGPDGTQGIQGPPGPTGTPGAVVITAEILFGSGPPDDGDGDDGEVYVDTDADDVYKKTAGHWDLQTNLKGSSGASFFTGNGVPDDGNGLDGDTYLDGITGLLYGKASGTWTATGTSLKGPAGDDGADGAAGATGAPGTRGSLWNNAGGAPGTIPGVLMGDHYLDADTGNVYSYAGGVWVLRMNIIGPSGTNGTNGTNGTDGTDGTNGTDGADGATIYNGAGAPSGGLGVNGDLYINDTTHHYYKKVAGSWADQGVLAGDQGPPGNDGNDGAPGADGADGTNGTDGNDGADGFNFLTGAGAPGGGTGNNGDVYLNATNGDVYGPKSAGSWGSVVGNLKGVAGTNGTNGARGSAWYTGSAVPSGLSGEADGDFYVRSTNGEIYQRIAGAWTDQGYSIKGPAGADGAAGAAGAAGSAGATGSAGARGSIWYSGSAVPSGLAGEADGDYYLRSTNGEVYKRVSGAWVDQTFSLIGPTGATGSPGGGGGGGTGIFRGSYTFSTTTTDSDPGAGTLRFSAADTGAADTFSIYVDLLDSGATDRTTELDALLASDVVYQTKVWVTDSTGLQGCMGILTAVTTVSGYRKLVCKTLIGASSPFSNAASVILSVQTFMQELPEIPPPNLNQSGTYNVGFPGSIIGAGKPSLSLTASVMRCVPFWAPRMMRVRRMQTNVVTAASGGGRDGRWFIFKARNHQLGELTGGATVYDSGAISGMFASAGAKDQVVSTTLPPGYYIAALAVGAWTGTLTVNGFGLWFPDGAGNVNSAGTSNTLSSISVSADETAVALSTCPALNFNLAGLGTVDAQFVAPFSLEYWWG